MLYSILKYAKYLIITLFFFINLRVDSFASTIPDKKRPPLLARYFNSKYCTDISFRNDSNIDSLLPRRFCIIEEEQDSIETCLNNIFSSEDRSKNLLSFYSYEIVNKLVFLLPLSSEVDQDVLKKINCYSETFLKINDKKKWLTEDISYLFTDVLPLLYTKSKKPNAPENLKVWNNFIQEIQEQFNPLEISKLTTNKKFKYYLISILFNELKFNQLDELEKYNLSIDILSLANELELIIPKKTSTALVDYLMKRNIEWDFPSKILLKNYSYDISFQSIIIKAVEKMNRESKSIFETYNSLYPFFKHKKTLLDNKCSIANFFLREIIKKEEYSDEESKVIESLIELKLNCKSPNEEALLTALPYSDLFLKKWCPVHKLCKFHFSNNRWLSNFASCSHDNECKSIKSENCSRIFFNTSMSRKELALYSLHCEKYSKNPILNIGVIEPACIDNICKGRK